MACCAVPSVEVPDAVGDGDVGRAGAWCPEVSLRARGTIATYANDGGKPVELDVRHNIVLNTRLPFLVLYTAGPQARAAAAEDIAAAVRDSALPVGEEHGLPLTRFPLHRTADAHRAVEGGPVGKVLVDITSSRHRAPHLAVTADPAPDRRCQPATASPS